MRYKSRLDFTKLCLHGATASMIFLGGYLAYHSMVKRPNAVKYCTTAVSQVRSISDTDDRNALEAIAERYCEDDCFLREFSRLRKKHTDPTAAYTAARDICTMKGRKR